MTVRYNPELKKKAGCAFRGIALESTKGRKLHGYQFMRQKPIGAYIVDFYCSKLGLVIEIDGESHADKFDYDIRRQQFLESMGMTVLRFNDTEVKKDIDNVMMAIGGWLQAEQNNPLNPPFLRGN